MAEIVSKAVAWLTPDPDQPRKAYDEADLLALGESLRKKQWYALLVRPSGMILDGERRWRAAKLVGLERLDVLLLEEAISRAEAGELQLVTALHRAGLSPFEQACGFRDWLVNNPGKTAKELAHRIDRDQSLLTKYLGLFDCVEAVQAAAADGRIGPSQWYPISLLKPAEQLELLGMHLEGVPRDQIAALSRRRRSQPTAPAVKVARLKIPLPGGATVQVSGEAFSLDDAIEATQEALKAMKKARDEGLDSKTAQAVFRDKAKAGA